jgi:hypothetical protein
MFASILILSISVVLLLYWFRYTCLLLLQKDEELARVARVAEANGLSFLAAHAQLTQPVQSGTLGWTATERALDRDYRILAFLLSHAPDLGGSPVEQWILALDFRLMQVWYRLTKTFSPESSRIALQEMTAVLTRMSGMLSERAENIG